MSSVYFDPALGGDGSTVTDDAAATTGLANGGHRTRFVPALAQVVGVAGFALSQAEAASDSATSAEASAASAVSAPGTSATSTTELIIGTGEKTLAIQSGKSLVVGATVKVASTATPTSWMVGDVTAYNSSTGALTVNVSATNGGGTAADWTVSLSGPRGPIGLPGLAVIQRDVKTASSTLVAGDHSNLIDCAGTLTLSFAAASTVGAGWWATVRNSGTGNITLDPDGTELIDGLSGYIMYPGEVRTIICDGTAFYSIVLQSFYAVLTVSGAFVKPPGYKRFQGLIWSGGNGGNVGISVEGGVGGSCAPIDYPASDLSASEPFVIGAGGTRGQAGGLGGTGGTSTFKDINAYAGSALYPSIINNTSNVFGMGPYSFFGGAKSSVGASYRNLYGASAGGAINSSGLPVEQAQSIYGGAGGVANASTNGGDGVAPGGGGGSTATGPLAGKGARGELRLWGII